MERAGLIFNAGLEAVAPGAAINNHISIEENVLKADDFQIKLSEYREIYILGAGKASAHMAQALENILLNQALPWRGRIVVKDGHVLSLNRIQVMEAAHPVPDMRGFEAAEAILADLESCDRNTLVISLISGGGSSLLPCPVKGLTLDDIQRATDLLLSCGAEIGEINAIRKHLSRTKGGRLARAAFPARVLNLMLSDVIGDPPDVIASGPFSGDNSSFETALSIIKNYALENSMPPRVMEFIEAGVRGEQEETPKPGDCCFEGVHELVIASNRLFLAEAKACAEKLGYNTTVLSSSVTGEASEFSSFFLSVGREIASRGQPLAPPACLLAGGELTVTLRGKGVGGRNQEAALAAVQNMAAIPGGLFFSAGTDGTDGPTEAAGAWCDSVTLSRALKLGLKPREFLLRNDSYHFFKALNQLVLTGPTGTNVMDCYMLLIE